MTRSRRGRSRRENKTPRSSGFTQLPYQQLRNPSPPMDLLSADELERIHDASMRVLEEIGVNFLLDEARDILKAAGAQVKPHDPCVRFDREMVMELVAKAPGSFIGHTRNPGRQLHYGGNNFNIAMISSPPNVSDIVGGRRPGNFADFKDLIRLGQSLNIVHQFAGYPVEPIDLHPSIRHLEAERAVIKLSDKMSYGYALGHERILDSIEMARLPVEIVVIVKDDMVVAQITAAKPQGEGDAVERAQVVMCALRICLARRAVVRPIA